MQQKRIVELLILPRWVTPSTLSEPFHPTLLTSLTLTLPGEMTQVIRVTTTGKASTMILKVLTALLTVCFQSYVACYEMIDFSSSGIEPGRMETWLGDSQPPASH